MSVKEKLLAYLSRPYGRNTLSTAQARARFGAYNVAARINELRQGWTSHLYKQRTVRMDKGFCISVLVVLADQ